MKAGIGLVFATLLTIIGIQPLAAQSELATLAVSDPLNSSGTAFATAISNDTAVVTQRNGRNMAAEITGAAYIFTRAGVTWSEQAKLNGSNALVGGDFGRAAAISGNTVAVSAPGNASTGAQAGRVYIFVRNGAVWSEQTMLVSPMPNPATGNFFGASLALQGDTLVVGANGQRLAFVFTRNAGIWTLQSTLSDVDDSTAFGAAVGVDGNTIAVGAPGYLNGAVGQGGVFVFTQAAGAWTQSGAVLLASNGAQSNLMGATVSISGDTILAGAPGFFVAPGSTIQPQGSAYVFQRSAGAFSQQAILVASDAAPADRFGSALAINGDVAIVGAPFANAVPPGGTNTRGGAYLFRRTAGLWTASARFAPATQVNGERFGRGVAFDGQTAVIGADQSNGVSSTGPGKAIVFGFVDPDTLFKNGFE